MAIDAAPSSYWLRERRSPPGASIDEIVGTLIRSGADGRPGTRRLGRPEWRSPSGTT